MVSVINISILVKTWSETSNRMEKYNLKRRFEKFSVINICILVKTGSETNGRTEKYNLKEGLKIFLTSYLFKSQIWIRNQVAEGIPPIYRILFMENQSLIGLLGINLVSEGLPPRCRISRRTSDFLDFWEFNKFLKVSLL